MATMLDMSKAVVTFVSFDGTKVTYAWTAPVLSFATPDLPRPRPCSLSDITGLGTYRVRVARAGRRRIAKQLRWSAQRARRHGR